MSMKSVSRVFVVFLGFMITAPGLFGETAKPTPVADAKEFQNGSFEEGLTHWNQQWWLKGRAGNKLELDNTIGRKGNQCAKIVMGDREGNRLSLTQDVDIDPTQMYTFSFSFYTPNMDEIQTKVRINAVDENGKHIGYYCQKSLSMTASVWVDYDLTFSPPPEARRATLEFNFYGPLTCYLDEVNFGGADPEMQAKMAALNSNPDPLFKELLIPGTAPAQPKVFPYWGYNNDARSYRQVALRYGWQYSEEEQYEELARHNLAPFTVQWSNRKFIERHSVPTTYYLPQYNKFECWGEKVVSKGAQRTYSSRPDKNDPILHQYFLDNIAKGAYLETPPSTYYFFHDEWYNGLHHILKKEERKSEYWKTADDVVREKYGFGKYGMPDSSEDRDPFKRIAYLRWQADLTVNTFRETGEKLKESSPQTIFLGPDELSSICPLDWERMGEVVDIQPGQLLSTASGERRFRAGYLVKYYRDLAQVPTYPFLQFVKYGASPGVETVYDWADQILRSGGSGLFVGCVEWYDRTLNHPKYAAPRKWAAVLDIVDTLQRMEEVRLPADKSMAIHSASYTQMAHAKKYDPKNLGAACAMLGPRTKAWYTFTDDFQIDRDIKKWDDYKVVVLSESKYVSRNMMAASLRFVENGGTLIVTDPEAFSFALDGEDISAFREKMFGVTLGESVSQAQIKVGDMLLSNPASEKALVMNITDPAKTRLLAEFSDGSPALVENRVGKGRVWRFAFRAFTDSSVDSMPWIEQWRSWLAELNVLLDHNIWRFELPRKEVPSGDRTDVCLTGNAMRYRRNFPEVSMNVELPGSYSYAVAPADIAEKATDKKIGFKKGLLTNRRNVLNLKVTGQGHLQNKDDGAISHWVVRFGTDETAANAIMIDLSQPCELSQLRLVFSGTLPETVVDASNGTKWTRIGALTAKTAGDDVLVAESELSGNYRYVRLRLAQRASGTSLTLSEMEVWGSNK